MGGSLREFIGFPLLSETSGMGSSKHANRDTDLADEEAKLQESLNGISIAQVQDYLVENGFRVHWDWLLPSLHPLNHSQHVSLRASTLRSVRLRFRRSCALGILGEYSSTNPVEAYHEILVPQCDEQLALLPGEGLEGSAGGDAGGDTGGDAAWDAAMLRETCIPIIDRLALILGKPAARIAKEISEMHPERGYLTKDPIKAMIFEQLRERRRMGCYQVLRMQIEFLRSRVQSLEKAQAQAQVEVEKGQSHLETPGKLHVGLMAAEIGAEISAEAAGSVRESISAGRAVAFASGFKVTSFNPYEIAENPAQEVAEQQPAPTPPTQSADEFEKLRQLVRERWNAIINQFDYKFFSPDYKIADDVLLSLSQEMQNPDFASRYSKMERDLLSDCVFMRTKLNRLRALTRTTPMESFLQKAKGSENSPVKNEWDSSFR